MQEYRVIPPAEVQLPKFAPGHDQRSPEIGVRALKFGHVAIVAGQSKVLNYFWSVAGTRTRISLPPIGHTRRIVPTFGFGPFQNGWRKNSTPLRTESFPRNDKCIGIS
jgi:hypothetical protein